MNTFDVPFAASGDKVAIPVSAQGDGSVSYDRGWTEDYELELGVDPAAKPIPRGEMNQLFGDVTERLRLDGMHGYMPWQAGAFTSGFPLNARVYHAGKIWQSLVAANQVEPSIANAASWADVTRYVQDASDTVAGVSRFATIPEHVAGTAVNLLANPAGVLALIQNQRPRHLGRWASSTVSQVSAVGSWVNIAQVSFNARAGFPVSVGAKVSGMNWEVSQGDNLWGCRVVIGATVVDVTTRNVGGQQTESNALVLGGRASLSAGAHVATLQVIKTFTADFRINADMHNGANTMGTTSWLQIDEGAQ